MKRYIRVLVFLIKLFSAYIIVFFIKLFNEKKRNVWIISERGDDARDNGYFFFEYMRKNHPEQAVYYVISRASADYKKVSALGNYIEHNSFKHFIYYALCKVRISAHMWGGDLPYADYFYKFRRFILNRKKFIFLEHGIYKDYDPSSEYSVFHPNVFCCGAKLEYEYIKENFGHPDGVVQYTGLARFDNLHNIKTKNQILVMPTFRRWLQTSDLDYIKSSEYVAKYNTFLNDDKLKKILTDNNLQLIFYPHYVMQKHIDLFHTDSENIKIASFNDYDVQQLLKESKLLVTDFSSVFFDFGYMQKPVVYYQFDRQRYVKEHYDFTKGYFSYDRDGFGSVVYDNDALIEEIDKAVKSGFKLESEYKNRIDKFFPLKDDKNCQRIFNRIIELL